MKRVLLTGIILSGCTVADFEPSELKLDAQMETREYAFAIRPERVPAKPSCRVKDLNWKHSDPKLQEGLCRMSRELGPVQVRGGHGSHKNCRTTRTNRSVKRSYHLYARGCKAADISIEGVSGKTILNWWAANYGGGRGYYCRRSFVHVDVGPDRTWTWFCGKRRRR